MTPKLACPLLGVFGGQDQNPSPEHVARTEQELKTHGKGIPGSVVVGERRGQATPIDSQKHVA